MTTVPTQTIDRLIREGSQLQAAQLLRSLPTESLPRADRLELARLCRRALIPLLGVRLLSPLVRPGDRQPAQATAPERAEFAACLINSGAVVDGLRVLRSQREFTPESLLFEAFGLFSQWDYAAAIPLLERYVAHAALEPYPRLVGRINLAAALVHERQAAQARALLGSIREECSRDGHIFLQSQALKFEAENEIHAHEYDRAHELLSSALDYARERTGRADLLFFDKWSAVIALAQGESQAISRFSEVRARAASQNQWETVRDCDYHLARGTRNVDRALGLLHGTPFEPYRRRFVQDCPWIEAELGRPYEWQVSEARSKQPSILCLSEGTYRDRHVLKSHQAPFRLLRALSADTYQPRRLTDLHSMLYAHEHFNPDSSPDRVHQLMRRLRAELSRARVPLEITESSGRYRLTSSRALTLRLANLEARPLGDLPRATEGFIAKLRTRLEPEQRPFSSRQVSQALGIPQRTVQLHLRRAVQAGSVLLDQPKPARYLVAPPAHESRNVTTRLNTTRLPG